MCVYVFSPDRHIEISYASEVITFYRQYERANHPATQAIIDLLICNRSVSQPVNELYIICPKEFYEGSLGATSLRKVRESRDITPSFLYEDDELNASLRKPPCVYAKKEVRNGLWILESTQPDLSDPAKQRTYTGYVGAGNAFGCWDEVDPKSSYVLTQSSPPFSIFKLTLGIPIAPGECQWMRWQITRSEAQRAWRELPQRVKDYVLNRRVANYRILGPLNVRETLVSYLGHFCARAFARSISGSRDEQLGTIANDLLRNIDDLLRSAQTTVRDWRLHVYPQEFCGVENVNIAGDVEPFGDMPTIMPNPGRNVLHQLVYLWKAGNDHVPSQKDEGRFIVTFLVRDPNNFVRLLPWIAFLLGLFNFACRYLKC